MVNIKGEKKKKTAAGRNLDNINLKIIDSGYCRLISTDVLTTEHHNIIIKIQVELIGANWFIAAHSMKRLMTKEHCLDLRDVHLMKKKTKKKHRMS